MLGSFLTLSSEASMTTAFGDALGSIKSDVFAYILIALPVGLAIVGAFFGIKKAVGFFKTLSNKA